MSICDTRLQSHAGLERVWIVGSMNPATTMGRQPLSPRLAALLHVAYMGYPSSDDLLTIYASMLSGSLDQVGISSMHKRRCCVS